MNLLVIFLAKAYENLQLENSIIINLSTSKKIKKY